MPTPSISGRDAAVVQYVARFRQLSSHHIQSLLFSDLASTTPCSRTLRRLVEAKYLHRVEHRMVGGSQGGSGQWVYSLGKRGYYMHYEGRYSPDRRVNYHALAIADVWLRLRDLERAGVIAVAGMSSEPDCWVMIDRYELRPDLYVELDLPNGRRQKSWLEIDMGTEGQRHLRAKLEAYWLAYNAADSATWSEFPAIWWVACDAARAKELSWLIGKLSADHQSLFKVCTGETLHQLIV